MRVAALLGEERTELFTQSMNQKEWSQFSLSLIDQMFIEIFEGPHNARRSGLAGKKRGKEKEVAGETFLGGVHSKV